MDTDQNTTSRKKIWHLYESLIYIGLFVLIFALYTLTFPFRDADDFAIVQTVSSILMGVAVGGSIVLIVIKAIRKKLTAGFVAMCILVTAIAIRILFMLLVPLVFGSHDAGGNIYYIEHFTGSRFELPDSNWSQYYHPPLFHMFTGMTATAFQLFFPEANAWQLAGTSFIVNCFASVMMLIIIFKLFKTLGLKGKAFVFAFLMPAFSFTFVLMSVFMNNEALAIMFTVACVFFIVRWYKNPGFGNIIFAALCLGLGMMTKTSAVFVAVFAAIVFLTMLIRKMKEKDAMILFQFLVFVLIAVPIGMWFQVRNLILFDQPFGYVLRIPEGIDQWLGDLTVSERYLTFPIANLFEFPFLIHNRDINPLYGNVCMNTIRTFSFGEIGVFWHMEIPQFVAAAILTINLLVLAIAIVFTFIALICAIKKRNVIILAIFVFSLALLGSYLYFSYDYPFVCTANYRYIMFLTVAFGAFIGYSIQTIAGRKKKIKDLIIETEETI